ncbi:periodic tryptophan protein 2 homolog [Diadema setosum]|uniref:periodic tryptophan protein 2 homolog n=1 Tax=Diadema setosum TaxID=31175 RepID=UPI003B3BCA55
MKFSYKFSNLLGSVYRRGNLTFTNDGDSVISPVGNRVTRFDLKNNKSETFEIELKRNIACVALSPDGHTAVLVDTEGEALLCSLISKSVLHHFNFNGRVESVKYSPNGKRIAATKKDVILVYDAPSSGSREFNPLRLSRTLKGAYDKTTCIDWTSDSEVLAVGSKDMSTRVYAVTDKDQLVIYGLGGHQDKIVACFFEENSLDLFTMCRKGRLNVWESDIDLEDLRPAQERYRPRHPRKRMRVEREDGEDDEEEDEDEGPEKKEEAKGGRKNKMTYTRVAKHFFNKEGHFNNLTCADYHKKNHILVVGFASGLFHIHEMPDFNLIHTLSISSQKVASVVFNSPGDWIAFGCTGIGQLLVWEWQSESYVLKQQGHFNNMSCLDYSRDGMLIVTGGDDGKVKLWNTSSGFCFVTFSEHTSGVTGVTFNQAGKVVVSSSLDGTVRAFDLHRYRNFRTFTSPQPVQFSCVAVDSSGDIVCAAGQDVFEIFMWSMKTGRLLEILAGHEGPVADLSFSPSGSQLASASWDKTVRLWEVFEGKGARETLRLTSDALCVAFRPDGQQLAVATLDFQITFWDVATATQTGSVEGRHDLGSAGGKSDLVTAKTASSTKCFRTLCYSADGSCVLAAGESKHVCIYHVAEQLLVKKFEITANTSLDGMKTGAGMPGVAGPGSTRVHRSTRRHRTEVDVSCVRFSATGRQWAATTTEGLLVYSLDTNMTFDPYDLTLSLTPAVVRSTLAKEEWAQALMMAFRMNEDALTQEVVETIPWQQVDLVCASLPDTYVEKMLSYVAGQLAASPHLEYYLRWAERLLTLHGTRLKLRQGSSSHQAMLTALQKSLVTKVQSLGKICDNNKYTLRYLQTLARIKSRKREREPLGMRADEVENGDGEDEEGDGRPRDVGEDEGDDGDEMVLLRDSAALVDSDDSETEIAPLL